MNTLKLTDGHPCNSIHAEAGQHETALVTMHKAGMITFTS